MKTQGVKIGKRLIILKVVKMFKQHIKLTANFCHFQILNQTKIKLYSNVQRS